MSNFFSFISRMKYIERWSLMRNTIKENIMEHSEQVAQIGHALALIRNRFFDGNINAEKVALIGMYHEVAEVITGDLPTPIKYYNLGIKDEFKKLELNATKKILAMLPEELQPDYRDIILADTSSEEYKLMKCADKICAYIKCIEEIRSGNSEFTEAKKSTKKAIDEITYPEVKYFMDNFIDGFEKTLDEINS